MKEAMFLERLAENLLEGGFTRALKTKLQPVQVAKALSREMERTQVVAPGAPLVANQYLVYLHPDDLASFAGFQASLERELARYLVDYAARRGLRPLASPTVRLLPASSAGRPGRPRVEASLVDVEPELSPAPAQPFPMPERTVEMPVVASATQPPLSERPPARLVGEGGRFLALTGSVTTLGRAVDNDIVLEESDVSRHHARIVWEAGKYLLVDLGSTNGTFVSGRTATRQALYGGEEVSFGGIRFTFQVDDTRN